MSNVVQSLQRSLTERFPKINFKVSYNPFIQSIEILHDCEDIVGDLDFINCVHDLYEAISNKEIKSYPVISYDFLGDLDGCKNPFEQSYQLKSVTITITDYTTGRKQIDELWKDVTSGKIPIVNSTNANNPPLIGKMINHKGSLPDYTIMPQTQEMVDVFADAIEAGKCVVYTTSGSDRSCVENAWQQVYVDVCDGKIVRAHEGDYELYAENSDGSIECTLYVSTIPEEKEKFKLSNFFKK